ncbi:MAG: glucose 1-dehydrogenase [Nitrospinota bacterium]|nr:MAG: glucose 1-dehydrogenase [Nitrospinota bacterium]
MSLDLFTLQGRVAVVTGGNGGIGKGMAMGLASAGADIVIAARNQEKTSQTVKEIEAMGRQALGIQVEVQRAEDVSRMVETTLDRFGRIDILINNAGIVVRKPPEELTEEEWDRVMDINLKGMFLCSKAVYPVMKRQGGGKIINIGSMMSLFGSGVVPVYATSKGGVVQLTKSLAIAWAPQNIQVNAVLPGWIVTDMTSGIRTNAPERYQAISERIPAKRWGIPDDLRGLAIFLASAASDYVTGTAIPIDGGYSVMGN